MNSYIDNIPETIKYIPIPFVVSVVVTVIYQSFKKIKLYIKEKDDEK